ncbi:MAG: tRNA lysidine(34) synthetase TilS [Candidatus Saccharimonadales bacterium]
MKTVIVAVSGGVDSVVLLDVLVKKTNLTLIVAHFDHGIRDDSAEDAEFVRMLAEQHGLKFETRREELGSDVSEEVARKRRYHFLHELADTYKASIATAHHGDDVIETMAINVSRGTGWRGIAILDSAITRPLLDVTKQDIILYAKRNNLKWREDSTNIDEKYLRNKIRGSIRKSMDEDTKRQLWALWKTQCFIKQQISEELKVFIQPDATYDRYTLTYVDNVAAEELLRAFIVDRTKQSPTRPQVKRALLAIKTAKQGTFYELGGGVRLRFTRSTFIVETL